MRYLFALVFCMSSIVSYSQNSRQAGLLPSLNISNGLGSNWKINTRIETRQQLLSSVGGPDTGLDYKNVLTDIAVVAVRKWRLNQTFGGGYQIRFRDGEIVHRLIQQYTLVNGHRRWRVGHRLSADQTFARGGLPEYRLRYRLTLQVPLSGDSVDPKEFYIKLNNEYLNSWEPGSYDLELRITAFIGYEFDANNKLEVGTDSRLKSFLDGGSDFRNWAIASYFLAF